MVFCNTLKTRNKMVGNSRKTLLPNEKLHVLFVPKLLLLEIKYSWTHFLCQNYLYCKFKKLKKKKKIK